MNAILGTEGNVRALRVLALTGAPITAGELARRARLGRTSIYPALETLEKTGIIEFTGIGSQRQVAFRKQHPLARTLISLFTAEEQRVNALLSAVRERFEKLSLRPASAWIEGISDPDGSRDFELKLWIVAEPKSVSHFTRAISEAIGDVEKMYGVNFDILGLTRSELESIAKKDAKQLEEAAVISGVPPTALLSKTKTSRSAPLTGSHSEHDARSRRLAVAIAAKLKRDPSLVGIASAHVNRRMKSASPGERHELQEWLRILASLPPAQLRKFLEDESERSRRLRQTLPALGLLTPAERDAVLASRTDAEARAAVVSKK